MSTTPVTTAISKIGIGTWDFDENGSALRDLDRFNFGWYYNWQVTPLWSPDATVNQSAVHIPMIWGARQATADAFRRISESSAEAVLSFNEPDNFNQANMTVEQALKLWPKLMATNKRLGSPATTTEQTLGENTWLSKFMEGASDKNYKVDFIAVHYYSDNVNVDAFRAFLKAVHLEYNKPIWVTEWALVDWADPKRFSVQQVAAFAQDAILMMENLSFVERQAWFGAYTGGDGWNVNTELIDEQGRLTAVGSTFVDLTHTTPDVFKVIGSSTDDTLNGDDHSNLLDSRGGDDVLNGFDGKDTLLGGAGNDSIAGGGGTDMLNGGGGNDWLFGRAASDKLIGGDGNDRLTGGNGNDNLSGSAGADTLEGGPGADVFTGGAGVDHFVFSSPDVLGGSFGDQDILSDFNHNEDRIDISAMDARADQSGSQDFAFIGTDAFDGRGQVRAVQVGDNTVLLFNTYGDLAPDRDILLQNVVAKTLFEGNFIF